MRWGVLGTARIAVEAMVPAIQQSRRNEVVAISSRDAGRARAVADTFGVPRSHGSYGELLDDPAIDAVYVPLPNSMHVEWAQRAAEAGKHVLCEKPLGLNASDVGRLMAVRDRTGVRIQESFMVCTHPQWSLVNRLVAGGELGTLRAIQGFFSFHSTDADDIVNQEDLGGGGLLDIGCYLAVLARLVTGREPTHAFLLTELDPFTGVDRLGSAVLAFGAVQASFSYSTQLGGHERMELFFTHGRLQLDRPFTPDAASPARLQVHRASGREAVEVIEVPACNQYTVAVDAFADAIVADRPQPIPLEDSLATARVTDALRRSAGSGRLEVVDR